MKVTVDIYAEKNITELVIVGIVFIISFGWWLIRSYNKFDFKRNGDKFNFLLLHYEIIAGILIGLMVLTMTIFK